jgi:hypothetical protein
LGGKVIIEFPPDNEITLVDKSYLESTCSTNTVNKCVKCLNLPADRDKNATSLPPNNKGAYIV